MKTRLKLINRSHSQCNTVPWFKKTFNFVRIKVTIARVSGEKFMSSKPSAVLFLYLGWTHFFKVLYCLKIKKLKGEISDRFRVDLLNLKENYQLLKVTFFSIVKNYWCFCLKLNTFERLLPKSLSFMKKKKNTALKSGKNVLMFLVWCFFRKQWRWKSKSWKWYRHKKCAYRFFFSLPFTTQCRYLLVSIMARCSTMMLQKFDDSVNKPKCGSRKSACLDTGARRDSWEERRYNRSAWKAGPVGDLSGYQSILYFVENSLVSNYNTKLF